MCGKATHNDSPLSHVRNCASGAAVRGTTKCVGTHAYNVGLITGGGGQSGLSHIRSGGGTMYGGVNTNGYHVGQVQPPPNQCSNNSNGRTAKRVRKFESQNLERGFAEPSIQSTPVPSPPPTQQLQTQPDTRVGGGGVWNNVIGNIEECPSMVYPDELTLPLLWPCSVDEPPSPDANDIQMSTSTWYEPEKDSEYLCSHCSAGKQLTIAAGLANTISMVHPSEVWVTTNQIHSWRHSREWGVQHHV